MTQSHWESRELRLLEAIAEAESRGHTPDSQSLAQETGLPGAEVGRAISRLISSGYLRGRDVPNFANADNFTGIRLDERGLRAVGEWPAEDRYDVLLQIIERHIETAATPAERTKYEQLRDGVIGVGRDVLTSVLSALARQAGGLP